jgi:zinc transport system substrate-binding protein
MKLWHWAAALSIFLAGCSQETEEGAGGQPKGSGRPLVYASNYPLKYFAERISAPLVDVRLRAPAGEDPAFWKPTPEDVLALQQADLVVLNGASYESWLKNVSLPTSRLVDTSEGFKEQFIAQEEATTHSHGLDGEHEHSATAFTTWLDLTLAVKQARAIKDAFSTRWPEHRGQFEAQFGLLAKELEALDTELRQVLKGASGVPVVFSHPVYQYFERRYGLNGRSVHWEPDAVPDEPMWAEFRNLMQKHPAKWMIWEGEPLPAVSARLRAAGVEPVVFSPCGNTPQQGDLLSVMRRNVEALRTVLGGR